MMGRLARWVGAALLATSAMMLGGCVGDATDTDDDDAVPQAATPVTLEPTPKVLLDSHQVDNGAPPPLDPVLSNGNPADPQPQPWVPPPDNEQQQGTGTGTGTSNHPQLR